MEHQQSNSISVNLTPPNLKRSFSFASPPIYTNYCENFEHSKSRIWVEREDFYCDAILDLPEPELKRRKRSKPSMDNTPYLLVGFDTEFKTPEDAVTNDEISKGAAKFRVLSYQFHASSSFGEEWKGICCPDDGDRMTLGEFLIFVLGSRNRTESVSKLPTQIYLIGHFTRADIPAFKDFKDLSSCFTNIRNTFTTTHQGLSITVDFPNEPPITLTVRLRDTILLTPASKKSLKALGDLMSFPKLSLDTADHDHSWMIRNMDFCRDHHWELFKDYAITDASISLRFGQEVIKLYQATQGVTLFPNTLSSIGVDMLTKRLNELEIPLFNQLFGFETHKTKAFSKRLGYFKKFTKSVYLKEVDRFSNFVSECYHGGRNEQYWFGPCFKDKWFDYDLHSAYPTAMSMIGLPLWSEMKVSFDVSDFNFDTLGYAEVEFEFPQSVRYPVLPVRTDNGIIFPLRGRSNCVAPEIRLAISLGASIKIVFGVVVPTNPSIMPFADFIKDLIGRRKQAEKDSLMDLFWKEITNSTYGKTAQGLRKKRVFDLRSNDTKPLEPSTITNAYLAAFITGSVRAILGEMMNALPSNKMVFSCTTDGFITNASPDEIALLGGGSLYRLYANTRTELTNDPSVLEIKHQVAQPLGWRTRGQATLSVGSIPEDPAKLESKNIVLAKGGIHVPKHLESSRDKNDFIIDLFFNRTPNSTINVMSGVGIRDIMNFDADFVERTFVKRLGMEFDWKRSPLAVTFDHECDHLAFSTKPWTNINQFFAVRETWDGYVKDGFRCLKSIRDFNHFAEFAEARTLLDPERRRYLRREDGDLKRLRTSFCSALKRNRAGISIERYPFSAVELADLLSSVGIPCTKADVENAYKKGHQPQSVPRTKKVMSSVDKLITLFPSLEIDGLLFKQESDDVLELNAGGNCPFIGQLNSSACK